MATYFYPTDGCIVTVTTFIQKNGDTLLEYAIDAYAERYRRAPDKSPQPHWSLWLIDTYMPVRESDVPCEVRQSWVYCYQRALPPIDNDPLYAV